MKIVQHYYTRPIRLALSLLILIGAVACQAPSSPETKSPTITPTAQSTSTADVAITATSDQPTTEVTPIPPGSLPSVWDYISDNFESGSLDNWGQVSEDNLALTSGDGHNGSTALSVTIHKGETYLSKGHIVKTTEGYLTFWFNPNNVDIPDQPNRPIPGKSIRIADIKGYNQYDVVAGLRIWKPNDSGYKAYLEWRADDGEHFDLDSGQFDLTNGWQKITLGFKINDWVGVWINDDLARLVTGVKHSESSGEIIEFGKANDDSVVIPVGAMYYDDIAFQIPRFSNLWVDAENGNDENSGLDRNAAFQTIQQAANIAGPGTKVHILPGIYRESVAPAFDGQPRDPTVYLVEAGPGTAVIRGSESSNNLTWQKLESNTIGLPTNVDPSNIYFTDLSEWNLGGPPRFLLEVDDQGNVASRYPLAREPDWAVKTAWKYQEYWWSADGGTAKANCNPATDSNPECDVQSRSSKMLTDSTDDSDPQDIEPGNLSTLGDLTGATLVAIDTIQGHYIYRRTIVSHNRQSGQITVDQGCVYDNDPNIPGLGWGTKYYVEGKPALLDNPGEWWYDNDSKILYLWSPNSTNPADMNIEISRQENGFDLSNRSNITLDGLTLEFFNDTTINGYNLSDGLSTNNTLQNVTLRYANHGVNLFQIVGDNPENITRNFTLESSEIAHMDSDAINLSYTWDNESDPDSFTVAGITDTVIRNNQLHHLSFRSDRESAVGVTIQYANRLRFEGNHIQHVAHNGVQFSYSVIQSTKDWGFPADEIKTGEILVKDNIFEKACQLTTDCGGLKFWGDPPDGQVYRDVLIIGNIFRNTFGWSSVAEKRGKWSGGSRSEVRGMGGFGLYLDMASGIHVYRNIAYNNAFSGISFGGVWRDGDILIYNNILANSLYGFFFSGLEQNTHENHNTQVINNILVNNEAHGVWFTEVGNLSDNITIDYNLYSNNGWRSFLSGGVNRPGAMVVRRSQNEYDRYQTLTDIQANTPWEIHGQEGEPGFIQYNVNNHNLYDDSWPDFHITTSSLNLVDQGTKDLPESLTNLLEVFNLQDQRIGNAYDIGRFELGED